MTSERTLEAAPVAGGRVSIFDTTLRDGEQSPGCRMNLGEKLRMARQPERLQVDVIEGRSPVAPPRRRPPGRLPRISNGHGGDPARTQTLAEVTEAVSCARRLCPEVELSCEDASRSDPVFLCEGVAAAIGAG